MGQSLASGMVIGVQAHGVMDPEARMRPAAHLRDEYKRAWMIGLAAATIMSLIGPRPLFVKTAYGDSPSLQPDVLVAGEVDAVAFEIAPLLAVRND